MSFHHSQVAAQKLYQAILADRPDLASRSTAFREHFLETGFDKPKAHLFLASLRLLTEPTFSQAARRVSSDASVPVTQTENWVLEAVNKGPDFLKADEPYLHDKGIMRGATRYFLGYKGIELGGTYDRAWRAMAPAYRPIAAEAVEEAIRNKKVEGAEDGQDKKKAISRSIIPYVLVAMLPEDSMKYFELNKLSIKYGPKHSSKMKEAARFIRQMAEKHNIEMPETMLNGLLVRKKATYEKPDHLPLPPSIRKKLPTIPKVRLSKPLSTDFGAQRPNEESVTAGPSLHEPLRALLKDGTINKREYEVYYRYHTEGPNGPRSIADIVDYLAKQGLDKGERYVRLVLTNVDMKLRAAEVSNDTSNVDRHQARAIRPQ